MQELTSFGQKAAPVLSAGAAKNRSIAELWNLSSDALRHVIADSTKDFSEWAEKDRITIGNFIIPALLCKRKNYPDDFIISAEDWELEYASVFKGSYESFMKIIRDNSITRNTPRGNALTVLNQGIPLLDCKLSKTYPEYRKVLSFSPTWVVTDEEKIHFVEKVYLPYLPIWYLTALQRINREQFDIICRYRGNALVQLCLLPVLEKNVDLYIHDYNLNLWMTICVGNSTVSLPCYCWEGINAVLQDSRGTFYVKERDGTVWIYDKNASFRFLPMPLLSENVKDPVMSYNKKQLERYSIEDEFRPIEHYTTVFPIWVALSKGKLEWFLLLKYFKYFTGVEYDENGCLHDSILTALPNLEKRFNPGLPYGTIELNGNRESIYTAFISGRLKIAEKRGDIVHVGTDKENIIQLAAHISAIDTCLRPK